MEIPPMGIEGKGRLSLRANQSSPLKLGESPRTKAASGHHKKFQAVFDAKVATLLGDLQQAVDDAGSNDGYYGTDACDPKPAHWTVEAKTDLALAQKTVRDQKKEIYALKSNLIGVPHITHQLTQDALKASQTDLDTAKEFARKLSVELNAVKNHLHDAKMTTATSAAVASELKRAGATLREEKHALEKRADVAEAKLETYKTCMPVPTVMKRQPAGAPLSTNRMKVPRSADVSFEAPTPGSVFEDEMEYEYA
jgi:hypothetical protein